MIDRIFFRNFKALKSFDLRLGHTNILIGPNNSGKSTVITALRTLEVALQRARRRNAVDVPHPDGGTMFGWQIPLDALPMTVENVHTNYDDSDATREYQQPNWFRE